MKNCAQQNLQDFLTCGKKWKLYCEDALYSHLNDVFSFWMYDDKFIKYIINVKSWNRNGNFNPSISYHFPSKCNEEKWFAQNDRGNNFHASCTVRFVKSTTSKCGNKTLKHNEMCISKRREEKKKYTNVKKNNRFQTGKK